MTQSLPSPGPATAAAIPLPRPRPWPRPPGDSNSVTVTGAGGCRGGKLSPYAIRNETSIGRAIKTVQQQNDIGVVRAPKGEQNSSVEKGDPQLFRVYAKHQLVKQWNLASELVQQNLS